MEHKGDSDSNNIWNPLNNLKEPGKETGDLKIWGSIKTI